MKTKKATHPTWLDPLIPPVGTALNTQPEKPKFDANGLPEKHVVTGFFEYVSKGKGWQDSFRVVDDDGMPFSLESLKAFDGYGVKITIEYDAEENIRGDGPDSGGEPMVYRAIGMTRQGYKVERERRKAAVLKSRT